VATKADVRDRTAELLAVKRIGGQTLQHEHVARINSAYDEVYDALKEDGLAVWASAGAIPDRVVPHLVALMAWNVIDDYGVSNERYSRIVSRASVAMSEIKKAVRAPYESQEAPADY